MSAVAQRLAREHRERRREYGRRKREASRRVERQSDREHEAEVRAGKLPPRPEPDPRTAARDAARVERQVRRLVDRGLRALDGGRWYEAGSDFIDAAAILDDQVGTIISREGFELLSAEDVDALFDVADVVSDDKGRIRAVVHRGR